MSNEYDFYSVKIHVCVCYIIVQRGSHTFCFGAITTTATEEKGSQVSSSASTHNTQTWKVHKHNYYVRISTICVSGGCDVDVNTVSVGVIKLTLLMRGREFFTSMQV